MADLAKTSSFSDLETLTAAKLNSLVDDARLSAITASDCATGTTLFVASAASPNDGDLRINSSTGALEAYDGSSWEAAADESVDLTFVAGTIPTLSTGMAVRMDYDGADHTRVTASTGSRNATYDAACVGVVVDQERGPGDNVLVRVRGPCLLRVFEPSSSFNAGAFAYFPGSAGTGTTANLTINPEGSIPGSCLFAQIKERHVADPATQLVPAFVFGRS